MKHTGYVFMSLLLPLLFVLSGCSPQQSGQSGGEQVSSFSDMVQVEYIVVEERTMEIAGQYTEEIRPSKEKEILPSIDAEVKSVDVVLGESVSKDQLLFTLDSEALEKEVTTQETNLHNAELSLSQARLVLQATSDEGEDAATQRSINDLGRQMAQIRYNSAAENLEMARGRLSLAEHRAPFDGTVVLSNLETGLSAQDVSIRVADLNSGTVTIYVDEIMLESVSLGQQAEVTFLSGHSQSFTGRVVSVNPYYYQSGKGYPVQVEVKLSGEHKPYGQVLVALSGVTGDAIAIPSDSVLQENGNTYVYVLNDDDTVTRREVILGYVDDESQASAVSAGLLQGEKIITNGLVLLKDGMSVIATEGK
ncbi:MAG: efflux RND transporter periplasmic adaptor subunit [Oscillospiraceae bacterium]